MRMESKWDDEQNNTRVEFAVAVAVEGGKRKGSHTTVWVALYFICFCRLEVGGSVTLPLWYCEPVLPKSAQVR